jgi:hypothetical protein
MSPRLHTVELRGMMEAPQLQELLRKFMG